MTPSLENIRDAWLEAQAEVESAEEKRDEYGDVLARRAHKILQDRHAYRRSGSFPSISSIDGDKIWFNVSNGIDYSDDFGVGFTLTELEAEGGDRLFHPSDYNRQSK